MGISETHWTGQETMQLAEGETIIREVKHDVYGRWQTAKITSDFLLFSCNHLTIKFCDKML